MGIRVGVQFLFVNPLISKGFSIPFNENRLNGGVVFIAVEPVMFFPVNLLTKGQRGVHFFKGGVHFSLAAFGKERNRIIPNRCSFFGFQSKGNPHFAASLAASTQ